MPTGAPFPMPFSGRSRREPLLAQEASYLAASARIVSRACRSIGEQKANYFPLWHDTWMADVVNNETLHRFEMDVEGEPAVLEYRIRDGALWLLHTGVPEKGQ